MVAHASMDNSQTNLTLSIYAAYHGKKVTQIEVELN